jgi:hypothetical protein
VHLVVHEVLRQLMPRRVARSLRDCIRVRDLTLRVENLDVVVERQGRRGEEGRGVAPHHIGIEVLDDHAADRLDQRRRGHLQGHAGLGGRLIARRRSLRRDRALRAIPARDREHGRD